MIIIDKEISNITIHYEVKGEGKPILLLHGWGASLRTFEKLSTSLSEHFLVYSIDLPGFGQSDIGVPLSISEVAELLALFCQSLMIEKPIILGHSYGGRIAIMYASKYPLEKLVLVSSAGIKQKLRFSKKLKVRVYKMFKKLHLPVKMGSEDYQNADHVRRKMLVQAVNQDLREEMRQIKAPTLLLYGTNDQVTPLSMGETIKNTIPNAYLIPIEECGHFPYLERPSYFNLVLMSFLVGDKNAD